MITGSILNIIISTGIYLAVMALVVYMLVYTFQDCFWKRKKHNKIPRGKQN